jgi:cytoskeletal protein CcmA (bactofilin family)
MSARELCLASVKNGLQSLSPAFAPFAEVVHECDIVRICPYWQVGLHQRRALGCEDIYVDGQVEGNIQLSGNSLTVGPNGRVRANITAKNVTVGGSLDGNIQSSERTEFRKTAVVNGDVQSRRIAIEEGAFFKGKLEIVPESKPQPNAAAVAASASTGAPVTTVSASEQRK